MKRNDQNQSQGTGYPQMNGYNPDSYPAGNTYQGYPPQQGYQAAQGFQQPQNSQQAQAYPQGFTASRSYQTPQVTGGQPPAVPQDPSSYTGQSSFSQCAYPGQNYGQMQAGYPGNQAYGPQGGYQQPASGSGTAGYSYPGSQPPAGSYIPQTPYSQGYTSPGYQAPSSYAQGYNAYTQMGRSPQPAYNPQQDPGGQVPLNGGGYVPQPVPVRRGPFVLTDAYLLIISAVLLALFALGMFAPGLGMLKWAFILLAATTTVILWIKPMVASNKRLCYTIVFGLLVMITAISLVTGGAGKQGDGGRSNPGATNAVSSGQNDPNASGLSGQALTPEPIVTNTPEPNQDSEIILRLRTFFAYWASNRQDDMLTLCLPSWKNKVDNPKAALFSLMGNRIPKEYNEENISGTVNDTSRTVTVVSLMDRNNGKEPIRYRLSIMMTRESDGLWYVDPQSLLSYDNADTPDPSITNTPAATFTPAVYPDTVLYYNPSGGEYYHLDQRCKRINERYLPLQGHFKYSELNKNPYNKLKPCSVCGAPSLDQ